MPNELVVDVDYFNLPGSNEDVHLAWRRLQDGPPIIWTPRNGGHWIATRGKLIKEIQLDYQTFSMRYATIPKGSTPSIPVESDPPEHSMYRAIIAPLFTPQVLMGVQQRARDLTCSLIEGFAARGTCEFMGEFAKHLPIAMFLSLVDLPFDDREMLLRHADTRFHSADAKARDDAKQSILNYLQDIINQRKARPGNDFISKIVHANIGDRMITDDEMQNMLGTVMSGGLDTVASMMGFIMRFLAMNPGHRQQLTNDPGLIPAAVDELIRRHGVANTARVVTHDIVYHGVELKKDEQILAPNNLHGLDDEQYEHALTVDFIRKNASQHASFGNGPHRCPGANLARFEIRLLLEEWLIRIPNFSLDDKNPPVQITGVGNSVLKLPLTWPVPVS